MKTRHAKKSRFFLLIVFFLLVVIGGALWYLLGTGPRIRNVLLISIDTCRADHLGCYGFEDIDTARVDALAEAGILYSRARTPVPMTLPAHCSMLTGTYPPYHQVHDNFNDRLREDKVTIAEVLREEGFTTGAIVSSVVLRKGIGLDQGFDLYNDDFGGAIGGQQKEERIAESTSRLAVDFISRHQDEPFFLFLHYFDPHDEYEPPEPFAGRYADDLYSGEIAYTDQNIGTVIDCLKELGLYDSTLIIVVGDHGEGLGEHGESTHGYYIYQSTIQVPFIIRPPGMKVGRRDEQTVSLVDVMPTVLGYLDLVIPTEVQGRDLSSNNRAANESNREVFTESLIPTKINCNPLLGVVSDRWSYIHSLRPELYDLEADPRELNNLADSQDQQTLLLASHLEEMVAELVGAESPDDSWVIDAESRRRLESLGYVGEVTISEGLTLDPAKKDPKDLIQYYEARDKLAILINKRDHETAHTLCRSVVNRWPEISNTYYLGMRLALDTGNHDEVIEYGRQFLARRAEEMGTSDWIKNAGEMTSYLSTCEMIARSAFQQSEYHLAIEYCVKLLQANPENPQIMNMLATSYFKSGAQEQAFDLWGRTAQLKPDMPELYNNMGQAYFERGDYDRAIDTWATALQLRPQWTEVRNKSKLAMQKRRLGQYIEQTWGQVQQSGDDPELRDQLAHAYYQLSDYEMAIVQWQEVLRLKPDDGEIYNNLGGAYFNLNQFEPALEHWRKAVRLKPDETEAYKSLAWLLAMAEDEALRASAEAVQMGLRAAELSEYKRADVLETLSIAYAANQQYTEAVSTVEKALSLVSSGGDKAMQARLSQHLKMFKAKRDGRAPQ